MRDQRPFCVPGKVLLMLIHRLHWPVMAALVTSFATVASRAQIVEETESTPMEFVRVAADGWNFETVPSGKRFVPFGSNMVFDYHDARHCIHILTQAKWEPDTIRQVFEGARALNMNVMKVFLTASDVLPDPQTNERVTFGELDPPLLERLDYVFDVARQTHIYVSLTYAEWGTLSLKWWQDGGIFVGRSSAEDNDIDSFKVFANFWKALAERYKDEPALLSYNLAVEFYLPGGNWGGQESSERDYNLKDRWGRPAWQGWLNRKYDDVIALNEAWGTDYETFDVIEQPEIKWNGSAYTMPQTTVADYNSFKEWVTYRFLKNQADAVRVVDKRHLITCGFHPHHPAILWAGAARYLAGLPPQELDFLDYVTVHVYTNPADGNPDVDPALVAPRIRNAVNTARFAYAQKPVVVEEMGYYVTDLEATAQGTIQLLSALRGNASGFMLWCLSEIGGQPFGPLDHDLKPNSFGREWLKLPEPGGLVATLPVARTPATTEIQLERLEGLAPTRITAMQKLSATEQAASGPVDFLWPLNPTIERRQSGDNVPAPVSSPQGKQP